MARTELVRSAHAPGGTRELSGIDRAVLPMVIRGTWLYEGGLDPAKLREGLAALLEHYPHVAGRMHDGRIHQTGEGVPFTHTSRPDLTLETLCDDPRLAHDLHPPWRRAAFERGQDPPLAAGLVDLEDGQALTLTCAHACMDGESFYTMARAWSRICTGRPVEPTVLDPSLLPSFPDRSKDEAVRAARDAGWVKPSVLRMLPTLARLMLGRLGNRSRPILLDASALDAIGDAAGAGLPEDVRLGRNDVITAHLTRMCARLCHPPDTVCQQVVVLDGRGHLSGVPDAFVGNVALSALGARFPAGASLPEVALATHRALAPWLARPSPALDALWCTSLELMRHRVLMATYDVSATYTRRPTVFYVNNFARMPVYDVDFGTGPPVRVVPHDLPDPILVWPAPPGRKGVEVYLAGVLDRASRAWGDDAWWAELRGHPASGGKAPGSGGPPVVREDSLATPMQSVHTLAGPPCTECTVFALKGLLVP
ncbi:MAG: hypothetical protein JXB39_08880 [Deltaproteobacteria bacterium]|nr:hypothetical protein [Deltaproteobacteria bacterium]